MIAQLMFIHLSDAVARVLLATVSVVSAVARPLKRMFLAKKAGKIDYIVRTCRRSLTMSSRARSMMGERVTV